MAGGTETLWGPTTPRKAPLGMPGLEQEIPSEGSPTPRPLVLPAGSLALSPCMAGICVYA